jgi:nucleolar protein 58
MYVLFETPAGFALFKVLKDEKKLFKDVDAMAHDFETPDRAAKVIKLKAFKRFKDTKDAMKSMEKLIKGDLSKSLKKFLEKNIVQKGIEEALVLADKKLGKSISE